MENSQRRCQTALEHNHQPRLRGTASGRDTRKAVWKKGADQYLIMLHSLVTRGPDKMKKQEEEEKKVVLKFERVSYLTTPIVYTYVVERHAICLKAALLRI
jgi:hypothetical protein